MPRECLSDVALGQRQEGFKPGKRQASDVPKEAIDVAFSAC